MRASLSLFHVSGMLRGVIVYANFARTASSRLIFIYFFVNAEGPVSDRSSVLKEQLLIYLWGVTHPSLYGL